MGKAILISAALLVFLCAPANSMKDRRCPPTGKGYSVSYTFDYKFGPGEPEIIYTNVCSVDAQW